MKTYRIGGKLFILKMKFRQSLLLDDFFMKLGFDLPGAIKEAMSKGANEEDIAETLIRVIRLFSNSKDQIEALSIMLTELKWFYRAPLIGAFLFNHLHKFDYQQVIRNKTHLMNCRPDEAVEVLQDFFTGLVGSLILPSQDLNDLRQGNGTLINNRNQNTAINNTSEASFVTPIL